MRGSEPLESEHPWIRSYFSRSSRFMRSVVQPNGLKIRQKNHDIFTGTIVAHLDEAAKPPANLGLFNLTTGTIRLRWAIIATLPIMADAFAAGQVSQKEIEQLRVSFDEVGEVPEDGYEFEATGGGEIAAGSLLSAAKVLSQSNGFRTFSFKGKKVCLQSALAGGASVGCTLSPESTLELALPKSLGGGTHRLNLVGGFVLVPIMTIGGREARSAAGDENQSALPSTNCAAERFLVAVFGVTQRSRIYVLRVNFDMRGKRVANRKVPSDDEHLSHMPG